MQKGSVNKVILVGHLGGDPEGRFTPGGTAVTTFSIATNESRRISDGNWEDHTEWHRCVLFGSDNHPSDENRLGQKNRLHYNTFPSKLWIKNY